MGSRPPLVRVQQVPLVAKRPGEVMSEARMTQLGYELNDAGFIVKGDKIMGRASGYGPGTCWYQLAARPFDEPSVGGFDSIEKAFYAAVDVILNRAKGASI